MAACSARCSALKTCSAACFFVASWDSSACSSSLIPGRSWLDLLHPNIHSFIHSSIYSFIYKGRWAYHDHLTSPVSCRRRRRRRRDLTCYYQTTSVITCSRVTSDPASAHRCASILCVLGSCRATGPQSQRVLELEGYAAIFTVSV